MTGLKYNAIHRAGACKTKPARKISKKRRKKRENIAKRKRKHT